jgi:hypothetical protein
MELWLPAKLLQPVNSLENLLAVGGRAVGTRRSASPSKDSRDALDRARQPASRSRAEASSAFARLLVETIRPGHSQLTPREVWRSSVRAPWSRSEAELLLAEAPITIEARATTPIIDARTRWREWMRMVLPLVGWRLASRHRCSHEGRSGEGLL